MSLLIVLLFYFAIFIESLPLEADSSKSNELILLPITSQNITINELESVTISVQIEQSSFFSGGKWMKKMIKPPRTTNITEIIDEDSHYLLEKQRMENGSLIKTLQIKQATSKDSGIYVYAASTKDFVKTIEFRVFVKQLKPTPRLEILSTNSYATFAQPVYPRNVELRVLCLTESEVSSAAVPVTLQYRISKGSTFVDPLQGSLTELRGTFEKGYQWITKLSEAYTEFKCSLKSNAQVFVTRNQTTDYDGVPTIDVELKKTKSAPENEDKIEVYEGDDVTFTWKTANIENNWIPSNITWTFKQQSKTIVNLKANRTNQINYTIKNITRFQSGEYVCSSLLHGVEAQYKRTIQVLPHEKPYRLSASPKAIMLKYDSEETFTCKMDGIPKPKYIWTKDGKAFTAGKYSSDNYSLKIPRVTAEDIGEFKCTAVNRAGSQEYLFFVKVSEAPERISGLYVGLITILVFVMIGVLFCAVCSIVMYLKQKKRTVEQEREIVMFTQNRYSDQDPLISINRDSRSPANQYVTGFPLRNQYQIDIENLEIGQRLGSGAFGEVFEGWLKKPGTNHLNAEKTEYRIAVAVKSARSASNPYHTDMLKDELTAFCAIGKHPNVLAFVGAVIKPTDGAVIHIATELCGNGGLREYLGKFSDDTFLDELRNGPVPNAPYEVSNKNQSSHYAAQANPVYANQMEKDRAQCDQPNFLATSDLIAFAFQIASGMEYLASVPCIHRDLAARNILLTNRRICKVADFGLTRTEEYYKFILSTGKPAYFPCRWMSIEAVEKGRYTEKSDVWSFGVLLYELFTLGGVPYAGTSNDDLLGKLKNGYRNPKPKYSHERIYELMKRCCKENPDHRPTFSECAIILEQHLELAAPQLAKRVMVEIEKEAEKQNQLEEWLNPEDPTSAKSASIQLPIARTPSKRSK